jgi:hypothetical protein
MKLALVLVLDFRESAICRFTRRIKGDNSNRVSRVHVEESSGKLAIVVVLQRALSKTAAGNGVDCVSRATIYLDENDQVFSIKAERVFNSDGSAAEHSHSNSKHLACAHMTMRVFGSFEQFFDRFHWRDYSTRKLRHPCLPSRILASLPLRPQSKILRDSRLRHRHAPHINMRFIRAIPNNQRHRRFIQPADADYQH